MSKNAVVFDIDGTLAEINHRLHYIKGAKKDYDKFFDDMVNDDVKKDVAWLNRKLKNSVPILIVSGRPDSHREQTENWLSSNKINYDKLYMRKAGDHRADDVIKKEIAEQIKSDGYDVRIIVDDRQRVVDMWRKEGYTVLQCDQWDEEDSKNKFEDNALSMILMVGPSGAGKSWWIFSQKLRSDYRFPEVVSADEVRASMCGNSLDQSKNPEVFSYIRDRVKTNMAHGLPICVDATHLKNRDRKSMVKLAPPGTRVKYVVINRPMEEKYRDGGWRNKLEFDLIAKHENTFKSNLKDILDGDGFPNVEIVDERK